MNKHRPIHNSGELFHGQPSPCAAYNYCFLYIMTITYTLFLILCDHFSFSSEHTVFNCSVGINRGVHDISEFMSVSLS